ncbi:hypothetical protein C8R44DRAFT_788701 [Mycena epipterygia]|nr:hypothetical protein C8R44DRAFT_788701 [Mycena epipterygia]
MLPFPFRQYIHTRQTTSCSPVEGSASPDSTTPLSQKVPMDSSYLRRTPVEIHAEIFMECVDGPLDDLHTITIPMQLASVCRRWRNIAIGTPRLWSRLKIHSESGRKLKVEMVKRWLIRSSITPLEISISWAKEDEENNETVWFDLLRRLCGESHRWERVELRLPAAAFHRLSAHEFPALRSIHLAGSPLTPELRGFLTRAATLKTLTIKRTSIADSELIQCLGTTPNLALLDIEDISDAITDHFLQKFAYTHGLENLVPRLVELRLDAKYCLRPSFADCIESRCTLNPGDTDASPLRKLVLKTSSFFEPVHRRLKALEARFGLEYHLTTKNTLENRKPGTEGYILFR